MLRLMSLDDNQPCSSVYRMRDGRFDMTCEPLISSTKQIGRFKQCNVFKLFQFPVNLTCIIGHSIIYRRE